MREALPYAVGVAVSPIPIAAILLLLTCRRAIANGLSFLGGWTAGVAGLVLLFVVLVGQAGVADADPVWIALADLLLGAAFLLAAIVLWTRRHRRHERPVPWIDAVDGFTTTRSAALGVLLSGANPKVVALSLGAALSLAQAEAGAAMTVQGIVLFSAVGAVGVLVPVAVYLAAPARAESALARLRAWLARHETTILVVLGLLVGVLFLGDGVGVGGL